MDDSFKHVLKGTKRKRSQQGRRLLANKNKVIKELSRLIKSGRFALKPRNIKEKDIVESGKERRIQFLKSYKKSIAVHAIMAVVDKRLKRRFIRLPARLR